MNVPLPTRRASRLLCGSLAILVAVMVLAMSLLGGSSAQPAPVPDAGSILTGQSFPGNNPGALLYTPEGDFTGANGQDEFVSQLRESFSNVRFDVRSTESAGPLLVVEFTMSGIHDGVYLNNPPRCAGVSVDGVAVLELGDQGIERQWIAYDRDTILAQIDAFSRIAPESRPTCDSQGITLQTEAPVDTSSPACMQLDSCSFDTSGLQEPPLEEPEALARPACVIANACFMLP